MAALFEITLCVLVMSTVLLSARGSVYSTPGSAIIFSQCLVDKINQYPYFDDEDLDDMAAVADVMVKGMRSTRSNLREVKLLVISFVTSLAEIIIIEDVRMCELRKGTYYIALQQCSISATGYVDSEFIDEVLRIMTSLERSKVLKYDDESSKQEKDSNPGKPEGYEHLAVQPSPVKNPVIGADYDSIAKTSFGLPEKSFEFPPLPAISQSKVNPQFPRLSASRIDLFPKPGGTIIRPSDSVVVGSSPEISRGIFTGLDTFKNRGGSTGISSSVFSKDAFGGAETLQRGSSSIVAASDSFHGVFDGAVSSQIRGGLSGAASSEEHSRRVFGDSSPFKTGSGFETAASSSGIFPEKSDSSWEEYSLPGFEFGVLRVPQTKESKDFVKPIALSSSSSINVPLQDESVPETKEISIQTSTEIVETTLQENSETMTISVTETDTENTEESSSSPLESIISDILMSSSSFREAFGSEIDQETAFSLARTITEQSLSGYNSEIIYEAMNSVLNAVASVTYSSAENYALAISNALASVLSLHNMPLFIDGARIADTMLTSLDNSYQDSARLDYTEETEDESCAVEPSEPAHEIPLDFNLPVFVPEDIRGEIFSNSLNQYILKSFTTANFFCNSDFSTNRSPLYFSIIKSSLSDDYDSQISSISANVVSEALMQLPEDQLCSKYARTISDAFAEVFEENNLLDETNAEKISKNIEFYISLQQITPTPSQPQSTSSELEKTSVFSEVHYDKTDPTLQSSFSNSSEELKQEQKMSPTFASNSEEYEASTNVGEYSKSISDDLYAVVQQYDKYMPEDNQNPFTGSDITASMSPINEPISKYETPGDYTTLSTALFTEITEEDFTKAEVLIDSATSFYDISTPKEPKESTTDDTIDQAKLAAFLLGEIESALEALKGTANVQQSTSASEKVSSETVTARNASETDVASSNTDETTSESSSTTFSSMQRNRKNKKRKRPTQQANYEATSKSNSDREEKSDDTTDPERPNKTSSRHQPESPSLAKDSTSVYSSSDSFKQTSASIELQPSFQVPQSSDSSSENTFSGSDMPVLLIEEKNASSEDFSSDSSKKAYISTEIQPSFQEPQLTDSSSLSETPSPVSDSVLYDYDYGDPSLIFAKAVSEIVSNSIAYIRSDNFNVYGLCGRLNELAVIADLPPVENCRKIAIIDYLLHVLRSVTKILKGV